MVTEAIASLPRNIAAAILKTSLESGATRVDERGIYILRGVGLIAYDVGDTCSSIEIDIDTWLFYSSNRDSRTTSVVELSELTLCRTILKLVNSGKELLSLKRLFFAVRITVAGRFKRLIKADDLLSFHHGVTILIDLLGRVFFFFELSL